MNTSPLQPSSMFQGKGLELLGQKSKYKTKIFGDCFEPFQTFQLTGKLFAVLL